MKKALLQLHFVICFILLFMIMNNASFAQCCLTNTLIINTGYDPIAGAAVPAGAQAGTPVPDPHWKICYMDPMLVTDITGTSGLIPVVPIAPADVIIPPTGWATYPGGTGGPGNWINSFNGYNYIQTTQYNYTWVVSRSFTLGCDAQVTFNFTNFTFDNWLIDGGIDGPGCDQPGTGYISIPGIVLTPYCCYGLYGGVGISVYGGNPGALYSIPSFTENLTAGTHTIYFRMQNDNTNNNNIGMLVQGYITTPSPSIVPEDVAPCTTPTICPAMTPAICVGASFLLSDNGIAGGTWSSGNNGVASVSNTGNVSGVGPGNTAITYNLPAGLGCPYITLASVNTGAASPADTTISVCATAGSVTLNAPSGYVSYTWSDGSTGTSISVSSSGVYWVDAFTGSCGTFSDTFHTTMKPSPVVDLGSDTSICAGISLRLGSSQPTGTIYNWTTGSTDTSINVNSAGMYGLTVTFDGCDAGDSVNISEMSKPVAELGTDTTLCEGNSFSLRVNAVNASSYLWSNGGRGQTLTILETGIYWVIVSNTCGSAIDTIKVDVGACDVALPTAFSPNGDGANDVLYVRGAGIKTLDLKIYNRFGQLVFETTDQKIGWDGTFNGQPQPIEAYAYVLKASIIDGTSRILKGNITLLR